MDKEINGQRNAAQRSENPLTIVGIGASAGCLEALKKFFEQIPEDSGLAFVVVVHLSPTHKSFMAELLQPHITLPVNQITKTVAIEANQVYIIPPGAYLSSIDSHLRLSEMKNSRFQHPPINHFFKTLAKTHDGNSIGVILTGTGSDGSIGIKDIKEAGGLVLVQEPKEAEFDGMPLSAIATNMVDRVLPLQDIAREIVLLAKTKPRLNLPNLSITEEDDAEDKNDHLLLKKVFGLIHKGTQRDFSEYKQSTILRRIKRRMQLMHVEKLDAYLKILRNSPEEIKAIADDFLIPVTSFFRDQEVYQQLEKEVIPALFDRKGDNESIRVWSAGCSTGEEVYSLTMLLLEEAEQRPHAPKIQVFASDLSEKSLQTARIGYYPADIQMDVSKKRLQRFFTKEKDGYQIRKEVRELVIFTPHNLLSNPPFSRIDLISCRNLLIYLKRNIQRNIFELFHYSLAKDGYLLLGASENVDDRKLFHLINKDASIYQKRNIAGPDLRLPVFPHTQANLPSVSTDREQAQPLSTGALHQSMVECYAPPSLLVTPDNHVAHLSESVGRYLVYQGGNPSMDLFRIVHQDLQIELRTALHIARSQSKLIRTNPIPFRVNGDKKYVVISIRQADRGTEDGYVLVMFDEFSHLPAYASHQQKNAQQEADGNNLSYVEEELKQTQQRLQALTEEYEASREEMKASNEELQSANEELRSTMEELETSKEELQSMNEELITVNEEHRRKMQSQRQISDDLQNLLVATNIATLFLDKELNIMRFTPQLGKLFNVRPVDRGRPISDQTHQLLYDELIGDAKKVLDKLVPLERQVSDKEGHHYLVRILPYRDGQDRIDGVVITFIDITDLRQAEEKLRKSEEQFRALVETSAQMVWTADKEGKVVEDSPSWREFTGQSYEAWKGFGWLESVHPEDREFAETNWRQAVEAERPLENMFRIQYQQKEWRWISVRAVPLRNPDNTLRGYIGMNMDITEQKEAVAIQNTARAKEEFLSTISHEIRTPLNAIIGLIDILLRKNPRPEQLENLNTLKFSSQSLLTLINDILDYSKIEAGKVELDIIDYHLHTLLHSIRQSHEPIAREKNNQLGFQIAEDVPNVLKGDPHKLAQILNNLISNANKFTENGKIAVEVKLAKKLNATVELHFAVRDTGIGISKEKIKNIFDKFTQADSSMVRRFGGTGLGLSITKSLLQRMGSDISVGSEEGKGSVFYFYLRQEIGDEQSLLEQFHIEKPARKEHKNLDNIKILLAEDAAINRMVLQQQLEEWWGITADEATNGKEAIEMAAQKSYDLILMDIRMPEIDGREAARTIRKQNEHNAAVPIIALTADTAQAGLHQPKLFQAVLPKPYLPESLSQAIEDLLQTSSAAEEGETDGFEAIQKKQFLQPNFQKAEAPFQTEKDKHTFYDIARKNLNEFKENFARGVEQKDVKRLKDVTHKAKLLFYMLGLDAFYQKVNDLRAKVAADVPIASLKKELAKLTTDLDKITESLIDRQEALVGKSSFS